MYAQLGVQSLTALKALASPKLTVNIFQKLTPQVQVRAIVRIQQYIFLRYGLIIPLSVDRIPAAFDVHKSAWDCFA